MKLKQFIFAFTAMLLCFTVSVNAQVAKVGDTEYATLQAALDAAAAGTGNVTVAILADVNLTGVDWNPVTVSAPGYPVVTVEGNDKTITGLNDMLFAGTWAGKSGLIIKNLTIANSAIVNDKDDAKGTVGVGAFIGYPQASATITLENCHLKNSSVEGGHWTGGLIGMAGGYNGADGPVFMNLTIKGCSVTGSTITGKGSVGGVIGHGSCAAWTNVVIEETTVSDNTITSTGSSNVKAGAVMGTIGAAGQPTTVNGVTHTGGMSVSATVAANAVKSNSTEITTIYGRQGTETGMLYIAGGSYDKYPIEEGVAYAAPAKGYKIVENNGTYGIVEDPEYGKVAKVGDACFETLAQAVAAVEDGGTITLIANETFTKNNRYNNGGWWDGLGYSGDKSFTIDLADFTISQNGALNDYLMWFKNDGAKANTITLKNGTLDAGTTAYSALATASSNAQKITVNLENINVINNNSSGATLKIRGGAELNANAGTIITGKNSYLGIEAAGKTTVVNIYEDAEIYQNGTSSYCGCLAGASGNSTINVYGGKGQSKSGGFIAMTSGGTINVEGGEWIANTDGTYANSNKSVLIAQSDKQYNAGAGNAVVNVTGGTFKGGYNCYGNKVGDAQINIKGGNFNADPTNYVAEDYIAVKNNGVWNVVKAAAKIGKQGYATVDAAIKAAQAGETITLIRDVTTSEILVLDKAITFDGNGKTLTSSAGRAINVSGADSVTIKNLTINASGERAINVIQNATNVTIEKVTATAANYTVNVAASAPNAVVAIKNSTLNGLCTVNVAAAGSQVTVDNSTVNCNDNDTTAGESYAALCLNKDAVGGSIVATNSTINVTEGSDSMKGRNGAENGTVTINGSTEGVTVMVAAITYSDSNYYHAFATIEDAIEFAKAGDVVTLIRDVTVAEKITIAKSITLDGNGKTITYTGSDRAIDVPANADAKVNVTIENLTVDCTSSYCQRGINYNEDGKLTLEGVTVKGTNVTYALNLPGSSDNCEVAINNSSLTGNIALNVWGENSTINAENTTFTAVDNNTVEGYAAVKLNNDGTTSAEGTVINITGGKIDVTGSAAEDTEAVSNGTSTGKINISDSTVVNGKIATLVAVIRYADGNSYSFETIEDAIAKAKAGETITLIRDVTTSEILVLDKAITFDGNGKTLTSSAGRAINVSGADGVTIKNLTINASGERAINVINGATNVIVENVTATAANYTVNLAGSATAAVVAIKNSTLNGLCTVNVAAAGSQVTVDNSTVNCNDNNTTAGESYAALCLNKDAVGGSIVATNSTINVTEGSDSMKGRNGAENGTVTINGSTEGVTVMVAAITYSGSNYYHAFATIEDAIEFAKDGDVVTLIRDVKINELVKIEKAVTLDLNDKKVTSTAKKAFEVHADATIKNGAIEAAQRCVDTRKAVKLTLTGVELVANSTTYGNPQPLTIGGSDNGTEVTMENVEINAGRAGYGIITFVETKLTATESAISGYSALYVKPGSDNSEFNFVKSDLSGSTVGNDVEGNSFSVIAVRANNVTVNVDAASTVTAAGNYSYAISFKSKSDIDTPATGSSVTVAGTITGNILADLNGNTVKVKAEYADELAAAGYATIEAENGLVAAIKAVAKIGETYYATLAEAIAAAEAGETVTMLENVTLDDALVVEEGMDITINGKGKTITGCDGKDVFYVKGGKLTLTEGLNVHATTDCAIYLRGGDVFTAANLTKSGDKYSVIQGNGNYAGNVTITGGKVEASDNLTAIYWPQNGKLTITGGEITGHSAVYIASGSLEITGGKLHGVGANGSYEGVTGGSTNAPGEALTIENVGGNSGYEEISSVVISGGEFISDYTKAVGSYANTTQNPEAKPVAGFISGGTFSSALEASYCAEGYGPYAFENGTFGVESLNVDDITIVDGTLTEFVNQNEKTVGTLTYKRSNIKNTWTPFYVPFAVPVSALADKFDVAYINDVRRTDSDDDGELDKFSMEIIYIHGGNANGSAKTLKANYPYFIRSKSGVAEMEITLTDATLYAAKENVFDCTTMTEKFEIKGNYHQIPSDKLTENDYVVGGGEWHPLADGYSLNPFRFYMTKSSRYEDEPAAPMQSMRIIVCGEEDENGATIIYDVVEDSLNGNGNDFIYDLQGRRVSEPKKGGIYIKNGKKILF